MFTWIYGFVCDGRCIGFLLCFCEEEGEKRGEIHKYNEKDTFTPIFNSEKEEVGNESLIEVTSGGLSDNF